MTTYKKGYGLTDTELEQLCKHYRIPLQGIYEKNELGGGCAPYADNKGKHENRRLSYGNYIVNLNGHSHWCSLIVDKENFWWDSFGFPPPENIEEILTNYYWNDKDIQNLQSTSCGYYCIAFLKFMNVSNKKKAYEEFVKLFDKDTHKNDQILFSLLSI